MAEPTDAMMIEHLDGQVKTLLRENERLREALEPFARGAGEIPDSWPNHRAFLIDEKHPDNPKRYCLLLARVTDFRAAQDALKQKSEEANLGDERVNETTDTATDGD